MFFFFAILNVFEMTEIHLLIDPLKASSAAPTGGGSLGPYRSLKSKKKKKRNFRDRGNFRF